MSLTNEQIEFFNDLAERVEGIESAQERQADFGDKLDSVSELAKNFDFGSEIAQLKQVIGQVVGFLGLDLGGEEAAPGAAPQLAAEGGMEKGDTVIALGEHSDSRKKEGHNFAAQLLNIPSGGSNTYPGKTLKPSALSKSADGEPQVTLMGVMEHIVKRLDSLEGTTGGRTSAEVTGEPVAKSATDRPLFAGKF